MERSAASTSVMSRFETEILAQPKNLEFLVSLPGQWVDRVHKAKGLLALPRSVKTWSLRTLREKLIKIGAKVVKHARYVVFQMAEVAVSRALFGEILDRQRSENLHHR